MAAEVNGAHNDDRTKEPDGKTTTPAQGDRATVPLFPATGSAFEEVRIPGYRIMRLIGQGGMGIVYKAVEESLDRMVALKVMSPQLSRNATFVERFQREAMAMASLAHPGITPVYSVGTHKGKCFFTMEYVRGPSLKEVLDKEGCLGVPRAVSVALQVAGALAHAHLFGVIHRDVKPSNMLFEEGLDWVQVSDFGLVKLIGDPSQSTRPGDLFGTPSYMSPEQLAGGEATTAVDIFSLGAVLYEMLAGMHPFKADTPAGMVRRIMYEEPVSVRRIRPEVPEELDSIIRKAMAKNPSKRFATMHDFADALKQFLPAFVRDDRRQEELSHFRMLMQVRLVALVGVMVSLGVGPLTLYLCERRNGSLTSREVILVLGLGLLLNAILWLLCARIVFKRARKWGLPEAYQAIVTLVRKGRHKKADK